MTMISDLPQDLVEEILERVATTCLGAVRSTCKGWNVLSKGRILCKTDPKQQFLGFMISMMDFRFYSIRFNLNDILNEDGLEFVNPSSIKEIGTSLDIRVEISQVFHCDGLLLCVTRDKSMLVVWNPYLGQTRWINPENTTSETTYAFGCDNNKNHKILRYYNYNQGYYEIYDLKSNSWRVFNVIANWNIDWYRHGASVNGNSYFWTNEIKVVEGYDSDEDEDDETFLICFDFTTERFGQFLPLPFQHQYVEDIGTSLSSVKDEKLAAFDQCKVTLSMIEIWITTKIEPNALSWIPFLKVDTKPIVGLRFLEDGSFFIDEEKKVVVVIDDDDSHSYIIGENGYLRNVSLGEVSGPLMCSSSYVPSLVQIDQIARQKKRQRNRKRAKEKRRRE